MNVTRLFTRRDVAELLTMERCIGAVEAILEACARGETEAPAVIGMHSGPGTFHIKVAMTRRPAAYFAAKMNGNFPQNAALHGLPTIQGLVMLCSGSDGSVLAVMDSAEITALRTAAATAIAARHLARPDSARVTICGCGVQGAAQLRALCCVLPLRRAMLYDLLPERAEALAREVRAERGIEAESVADLGQAVSSSDVCVTCTPSRNWYLDRTWASPGIFIAAVGADNESKQEIDPHLMAAGKVVVDSLEQAATIGDLHHALVAEAMTRDHVYAELPDIVVGRKPGRTSASEITLFDSTGTALEDVAAAVAVYEAGNEKGLGMTLDFRR